MDVKDSHDATVWSPTQQIALVVLLVAIFLFQVATLRENTDWGGDFAQYLNQARNVTRFHDMNDTGYVYNPDAPVIGPRAYPPIFSVFLAPIYALLGADYHVLKIAMICLSSVTLTICSSYFARQLSPWNTLALVAMLGFSRVFWEFNHWIISEHLFVVFWMLAMWLYQRDRQDTAHPSDSIPRAVLLGLVIYLAIGTRTVGIVLPPALILTELILYRRLTRYMMVSISSAVAFYAIQKGLVPSGGSGYLDQLSQITVHSILFNLYADGGSFTHIWDNGYKEWLMKATGIPISLVAIAGCLRANWPKPQFLFVASVLYFILIVIWPGAAWDRMIWPLYPGFLAWLLYACEKFPRTKQQRTIVTSVLLLYTFGCYTSYYYFADFSRISGPEDPAAQEVFAQVATRMSDDPNDVCLFFKPRVLAFYVERKSIGYPIDLEDEAALHRTIDDHNVKLAVTQSKDPPQLPAMLAAEGFTQVWSNQEFQIWQPTPKAKETPSEP
ncbi:hypothetical protein [Blastopirellula marina]|uniref:Glycosyltransferase RgtA/B/C/D-like domain-containing protein n=1 Tax=Blastopirellula marina TaxID=124 RepID=A0A2S8F9V2_9BACT|nr:hypothetical protein [Blastopirellula marina]PQO28724.1 hypothetical protein C5Y98_23355 [Blastopirellula marina]PTL41997.1 hypothetical protein C5Y97_23370 [Blastopirellula marina]